MEEKRELAGEETLEQEFVRVFASAKKRAVVVWGALSSAAGVFSDGFGMFLQTVSSEAVKQLPVFQQFLAADVVANVAKWLLVATIVAASIKALWPKKVAVPAQATPADGVGFPQPTDTIPPAQ